LIPNENMLKSVRKKEVIVRKKVVIIGGVAGGATAAAKLRRLCEHAEIILCEKDEHVSFANCGLPYYIGQVINERDDLIVQTVEDLSQRFNLDIRNFSEVIEIYREEKYVVVKNVLTQQIVNETYDTLILSPGASPIIPAIEGLSEANNVFVLRNIPHTDAIDSFIKENNPKNATIIGGGFIGIEMAENLCHRGLNVTVLDMAPQVLAPIDFEMAQYVHAELVQNSVTLRLNEGIKAFHQQGKIVETTSRMIETDLTILAIGVSSEIKLAQNCGLEIGQLKGIVVNDQLQTSDPNIYAIGDAIEVKSRINNKPIKIPLAWPANRQGVVVANIISGKKDRYIGSLGTAVAKVFNLTVASTGFNEKMCKLLQLDYQVAHINRYNHASYYPDATSIALKIVFNPSNGTIYGAQAVGMEGTEKRIDVIATAITGNLTITDLANLELCYAPPYGSAKDPVNILGYVATNVMEKTLQTVQWHQVNDLMKEKPFILDVRTQEEFEVGHLLGSVNIAIDDLRKNLDQLPNTNQPIFITCQIGHRGYLATQILQQHGYQNVVNLDGGYGLYEISQFDFTQNIPFVASVDTLDL